MLDLDSVTVQCHHVFVWIEEEDKGGRAEGVEGQGEDFIEGDVSLRVPTKWSYPAAHPDKHSSTSGTLPDSNPRHRSSSSGKAMAARFAEGNARLGPSDRPCVQWRNCTPTVLACRMTMPSGSRLCLAELDRSEAKIRHDIKDAARKGYNDAVKNLAKEVVSCVPEHPIYVDIS